MNEIELKELVEKNTINMNSLEAIKFIRLTISKFYEFNNEGQWAYINIYTIEEEIKRLLKELNYKNIESNESKYFIQYIIQKVINIEPNNKRVIINIAKKNKSTYEDILTDINHYYLNNKSNSNINSTMKILVKEVTKRLMDKEKNKENQEKCNKLLQK